MPTRILVPVFALPVLLRLPVQAAEPQGEIRVAIPWTPENLDPTLNLSSIRAQVGVSIFDSLVGRDAEKRIVPELAESWKLLDDNTWQFRLRRGVVFHNGELDLMTNAPPNLARELERVPGIKVQRVPSTWWSGRRGPTSGCPSTAPA